MSQSSSIFARTISHQVFLQLSLMWSTTATLAGKNTVLITEEALLCPKKSGEIIATTQYKLGKILFIDKSSLQRFTIL